MADRFLARVFARESDFDGGVFFVQFSDVERFQVMSNTALEPTLAALGFMDGLGFVAFGWWVGRDSNPGPTA